MLSNRERQILVELVKLNGKQVTSHYLAQKCGKSVRTIQQDLKELKYILQEHGAMLSASHKDGYQLCVLKPTEFQSLYKECRQGSSNLIETKNDRTIYMLQRLLESDVYIKSDCLSDELFSSKSTIQQSMKDMKQALEKYGLRIDHKPYYGMRIEGDEKAKRKCIINEIMAVQNFVVEDHDKLFEKINEVTANCFIKMQYKVDDVALMNLLMHIYTSIKRMMMSKYINFNTEDFDQSTFSHEIQMAREIYEDLSNDLGFHVTDDEVYNLAVYMKGKRNYENGDVITEEVNALISDMLSYIKEKLNIDLSYDVELQVALALHFLPLNIRLENEIQLKNPILNDIKQKFTFAYELATSSGAFLNEKFGYILNETELGYLAIHYNLSLDKQTVSSRARRILILCSSRTSDSLLLKYTLKKWFNELVLEIDILNLHQAHEDKLKQYDVIFTTVEEGSHVPKNAIKINYFLDQNDYLNIQKAIHQNGKETQALGYFEKRLFLNKATATAKEDVIKEMSDLALKYKKVDPNLYESVILRESYGFTSYGNLIAVPHPNDLISDETFVVTAILENPISWGGQNVQLVFLICTEKDSCNDLKCLFGIVSRLLSNLEMIQNIIDKRDFEYMMKCLKKEL